MSLSTPEHMAEISGHLSALHHETDRLLRDCYDQSVVINPKYPPYDSAQVTYYPDAMEEVVKDGGHPEHASANKYLERIAAKSVKGTLELLNLVDRLCLSDGDNRVENSETLPNYVSSRSQELTLPGVAKGILVLTRTVVTGIDGYYSARLDTIGRRDGVAEGQLAVYSVTGDGMPYDAVAQASYLRVPNYFDFLDQQLVPFLQSNQEEAARRTLGGEVDSQAQLDDTLHQFETVIEVFNPRATLSTAVIMQEFRWRAQLAFDLKQSADNPGPVQPAQLGKVIGLMREIL
jgi:hypothetical protein